ncbi:MAG: helix-turn-helix domain-containing protein, partial [Pseudomonadota bacterium]
GRFNASEGTRIVGAEDETLKMLCAFDWPGNVRQLENAVFRAVVLCEGDLLQPHDFPQISGITPEISALPEVPARMTAANDVVPSASAAGPVSVLCDGEVRSLADVERDLIAFAIEFYAGHMSEVSRRLEIGRSTLYRKVREYELDVDGKKEAS